MVVAMDQQGRGTDYQEAQDSFGSGGVALHLGHAGSW